MLDDNTANSALPAATRPGYEVIDSLHILSPVRPCTKRLQEHLAVREQRWAEWSSMLQLPFGQSPAKVGLFNLPD